MKALRLFFTFDGDEIDLYESAVVEMRTPPTAPLNRPGPVSGARAVSGHWVEVRDVQGAALYRRLLHDPLSASIEAPDGAGGWQRKRVNHPRGAFGTVVPLVRGAKTVALVGSPRTKPYGRARDLAVFKVPRG